MRSGVPVDRLLRPADAPPPPRKLRRRPDGTTVVWERVLALPGVLILFSAANGGDVPAALVGAAVVIVFAHRGWVIPWRRKRALRLGEAIEGVVTAKYGGRRGVKSVDYAYEVAGRTYHGRTYTDDGSYQLAEVGEPITVFYDPRRPRYSLPYDYCAYNIVGTDAGE